jgi:hypothetical protein
MEKQNEKISIGTGMCYLVINWNRVHSYKEAFKDCIQEGIEKKQQDNNGFYHEMITRFIKNQSGIVCIS